MTHARMIRRACYPVFLATTGLWVVLACVGIWTEAESLVLWKAVGSAAVVSFASALTLSATRVAFGDNGRD